MRFKLDYLEGLILPPPEPEPEIPIYKERSPPTSPFEAIPPTKPAPSSSTDTIVNRLD